MNKATFVLGAAIVAALGLVACGGARQASTRQAADRAAAPAGTSSTNPDPLTRTFPKAKLLSDFDQFAGLVEERHPKLYADRKRLASLLATNRGLVREGMTELEFLRLLSPIVAALKCGHSSISLSEACQRELSTRGRYFPLPLRFMAGRAYVAQNGLAPGIPVGSEILAVNGLPTGEIITSLFANLPADGDNETRKYMLLNGWFRYRYHNFLDKGGPYEISYRVAGSGEVLAARLPGATNEEIAAKNRPTWSESEVPFSSSFDGGHATLAMSSFYPESPTTISDYRRFIDAFFKEVRDRGVRAVILDVRDNGGGDPEVTSHLWSYLARRAQPYFAPSAPDYYPGLKSPMALAENRFEGDLYVLMNGGSFSSTGHLLALLKSQGVGVFIGEESAGSFACTDSSKDFVLSATGLQFRSSTQVWAVAAEGLAPGRGIMPDHRISQDMAQYLEGRDVVMEFALGLAAIKRGG